MSEPAVTEGEWQRLHPLSPVLRGGLVLLAVVGYAASQLLNRLYAIIGVDDSEVSGDVGSGQEILAHPLIAAGATLVSVLFIALVNYVSWRATRFRVGDHVELRSGILFRSHRQVPVERIQAVELSRPLLARVFGLAQVIVQSAGGSDSDLTLSYLAVGRAEEVRADILELAGHTDEVRPRPASVEGVDGGQAPDGFDHRALAEPTPDIKVPNGRLFASTLLHGSTAFLVAALAVGATAVVSFGGWSGLFVVAGAAPALLPALVALAIARGRNLLVNGNFSLARTETSLRVRHGLTDLRHSSVPLHRVQAVEVSQSLWWRPFGWWRIVSNVAGVKQSGDDVSNTTLLPVGTQNEALLVLSYLGVESSDPLILEALATDRREPSWIGPPRRARVLNPFTWNRAGFVLSESAVVIRSGRWNRKAVVVPHGRVQSLSLEQGPLQRRLHLASIVVVSTVGPVRPKLPNVDADDAERFLADESARATAARRLVEVAQPTDVHVSPGPPLA